MVVSWHHYLSTRSAIYCREKNGGSIIRSVNSVKVDNTVASLHTVRMSHSLYAHEDVGAASSSLTDMYEDVAGLLQQAKSARSACAMEFHDDLLTLTCNVTCATDCCKIIPPGVGRITPTAS